MKTLLLSAFALSFLLTGCVTDADLDLAAPIKGEWKMNRISYTGATIESSNGLPSFTTYEGDGNSFDLDVSFGDTPTDYRSKGSFDVRFQMVDANGEPVVVTRTFYGFCENGLWQESGQRAVTVTDTPSGLDYEMTIIDITETTMRVHVFYEKEYDTASGTRREEVDMTADFERL